MYILLRNSEPYYNAHLHHRNDVDVIEHSHSVVQCSPSINTEE